MTIDELTSLSDVESIVPEWEALYERCRGATPFHSADWLVRWWKHFGFGSLWVLAVRQGRRLAGIAPLFIHNCHDGQSSFRQLSPVGIGITDYMDFLLAPDCAATASGLILQHLAQRTSLWDAADLQGLREGCELLRANPRRELKVGKMPDQPCPFIRLPKSRQSFLASLSRNRRHVYQSAQTKVSGRGPITFESAQPSSWQELMDALVQLNHASRVKRRLRAAFDDPKVRMFHREVGEAFLRRGWLRTIAMRIGARIVAVLHGFASGQRWYCYQTGFDPGFQKFSPGTVVQGQVIERAIEEGLDELDFLRGDEPYKYWWGACNRQTCRMVLRH
ncbi:MAG TPA: GNAT family N-acetyltransferase [Terriglobia bacterium]|nr:GNAT family N-acetyltransferase [Terriglobia bacterium]